jgi:hypothetical protein
MTIVTAPLAAILAGMFFSYGLGWSLAAFISARPRGEPSWGILAGGAASGLLDCCGVAAMTRRLTEAEARFLATRDEILSRRNPELLARENAEFEAMSDEELRAAANPWGPPVRRRVLVRVGEAIEKLGRRLASR